MDTRGLLHKYHVSRVDGSDGPGGKHAGCWFFVLDPAHDPYARVALVAYADAAAERHPNLARELVARAERAAGQATKAGER